MNASTNDLRDVINDLQRLQRQNGGIDLRVHRLLIDKWERVIQAAVIVIEDLEECLLDE